jgi:peroxiredoxin
VGTSGPAKVGERLAAGICCVEKRVTLFIHDDEENMRSFTRYVALVVVALFIVSCASAGDPAPNFKLKTADGKTVELKKLAGKAVVLNFWATWCGPCRQEIPGMVRVYEKYKSKGLEIVGISVDQRGWDVLKQFLAKNTITYPIVLGGQEEAEAYGGIEAIPTTFFVDRKGNIVSKAVGAMEEEDFEKAVKGIL